ncbi:LD-carboxypeptidase [Desulfonema ishimotonii]|uniref:LD-carboxypeptidase n=1 Tax=Desulfonema ishimotonii TaxID=45657 RepID=A0A401G4A4_9BACT|nr:LD-carboxypeptidase [Desulfonema ishimotonii]GBC64069.1 LD-carboxypeptidase [Desulfonema ishimotonii]
MIQKNIPILPGRLKPGDRVGVIAPASPVSPEEIAGGVAVLEAFGVSVWLPDGLFERQGYLAGSDDHRAHLINTLFADERVRAIVCARGGFGSVRTLSRLDFDLIGKHPKPLIGFSDISALLNVLYEKCGLITFHGPVLSTLADADSATKRAMRDTLLGAKQLEFASASADIIHGGWASGTVVGGNLSTLCHLLGTPFAPDFSGSILFLEDVGEPGYRIDRMLTQMKLAGCFERLAGLALGSFKDCAPACEIFGIAGQIVEGMNIPVVGGFDMGHGRCNLTFPIGAEAVLDAENARLVFHTGGQGGIC